MPEQTPTTEQKPEVQDFDKYLREAEFKELDEYRKGTGPAPVLYRAGGELQKADEGDKPFIFIASEESEDRLGDVITASGWELKNFQKNPVFLFGHDQHIPPIGSVAKIWLEGKQLMAHVRFDEKDDFAALVKGKFQRGFMKAVSVGFRALEFEEMQGGKRDAMGMPGLKFLKQELVELSAVGVPAHPNALMRAMKQQKFYSLPAQDIADIKQRLTALETVAANPTPQVEPLAGIADEIRNSWIIK